MYSLSPINRLLLTLLRKFQMFNHRVIVSNKSRRIFQNLELQILEIARLAWWWRTEKVETKPRRDNCRYSGRRELAEDILSKNIRALSRFDTFAESRFNKDYLIRNNSRE